MSSVRTFVLFLLVLFLSSCISAISLVEERKITAVAKAAAGGGHGTSGAHGGGGSGARGGGSSEAGGASEGGGGEGSRTPSGVIPAVVIGGAGAANARHGARKHNAATISHGQPIYIPLVATMLGVAILLFV
ncbi:hypothetical protein IHE45_05G009000 [Dioscorea alata]|uniref:Uncharacterized protein n=1 Tax=Dioscorea alata TaxID=55571 RepID=A0ACB7VZ46_DIOAL|nr:hypothetical protein IHE45_05G009000 [Dioscorea alata]